MKSLIKILMTILFLTGGYNLLQAQLGLGVRGGVNFATAELEQKIDGSWHSDNKDFIPRLQVGLLAEYGFSNNFAFQPEVHFIQKGYKTTYENGTTYDYKVMMNYVEVPVLLKGRFGSDLLKVNILAGPSFGYAFNGTTKAGNTETDIDFSKDEIKQYDIGAIIGLGVDIKAGPGSFFVDGRLGWGITNLNDAANSDNVNMHNRGISIGAGYIFRLFE